jgi:hypothetical protein
MSFRLKGFVYPLKFLIVLIFISTLAFAEGEFANN